MALALAFLGIGCEAPTEQDGNEWPSSTSFAIEPLITPPDFQFETQQDVVVSLRVLGPTGHPMAGTVVAFSQIQDEVWAESRRRITDPNGLVSLRVPVLMSESRLGIAVLDPLFPDSSLVDVNGGYVQIEVQASSASAGQKESVLGALPSPPFREVASPDGLVVRSNATRPDTQSTTSLLSVASPDLFTSNTDSDGDGVVDEFDVDPFDRDKAFLEYDPGRFVYGSLVFEDMWPQLGDYDFNDLVLDYNTTYVVDMKGSVTEMTVDLVVRAIGAGYRNGLGFQLDIPPGHVRSVSGQSLSRGYTKRNGNGTEAGQPRAVIIAFEDAYDVMPGAGGNFANTRPESPSVGWEAVSIRVVFNNPIPRYKIGNAPYNIFLISSGDRGREIHLPGNEPTALASRSMFGSGDDASNGSNTYRGTSGLPWAMHVPRSFDYPRENVPITQAHRKFRAWAESGGRDYPDWYLDKEGYRLKNGIY